MAPVEVLKLNPSGNVPIKLYEAAGLPLLLATEIFTAVTLSAVTEDDESVMFGAEL